MKKGFTESKMQLVRIVWVVASVLLSGLPSYASRNAKFREGNSSGGGGDAIVCEKDRVRKVFLADTFELLRQNKVESLADYREEVYSEALLRTIEALNHDLGTTVRARLRELKFRHNVEATGLLPYLFPSIFAFRIGELDNDHLIIEDRDCRKQQLARQKIEKRKVRDEFSLFVRLTPFERGVYPVHESLISVRHAERDTTGVRREIAAFVSSPEYVRQLRMVAQEIQELPRDEKVRWLKSSVYVLWRSASLFISWGESGNNSYIVPDFHRYQASTDRIYIRVADFREVVKDLGVNPNARFIGESTALKIAEKLVERVEFPSAGVNWL